MTRKIPHPEKNPYEQNRKNTRWNLHDYATSSVYFLTVCTKERYCWFGDIVNGVHSYTPQGYLADAFIYNIPLHYKMAKILNYVVMPDHIHILLVINNEKADIAYQERDLSKQDMRDVRRTTKIKDSVSSIMASFKSSLSRHCHRMKLPLEWQDGFNDRVVRDQEEEDAYYRYIENNPGTWKNDAGESDLS